MKSILSAFFMLSVCVTLSSKDCNNKITFNPNVLDSLIFPQSTQIIFQEDYSSLIPLKSLIAIPEFSLSMAEAFNLRGISEVIDLPIVSPNAFLNYNKSELIISKNPGMAESIEVRRTSGELQTIFYTDRNKGSEKFDFSSIPSGVYTITFIDKKVPVYSTELVKN